MTLSPDFHLFSRPFEEFIITDEIKESASEDLRKLLALDFQYPTLKE